MDMVDIYIKLEKVGLYTTYVVYCYMKSESQFNIPKMSEDLRWELKKYAVFHKTSMYEVAIKAIKVYISYDKEGEEK